MSDSGTSGYCPGSLLASPSLEWQRSPGGRLCLVDKRNLLWRMKGAGPCEPQCLVLWLTGRVPRIMIVRGEWSSNPSYRKWETDIRLGDSFAGALPRCQKRAQLRTARAPQHSYFNFLSILR